jgi:hypothetical protein
MQCKIPLDQEEMALAIATAISAVAITLALI